jgi:hypothetical protein
MYGALSPRCGVPAHPCSYVLAHEQVCRVALQCDEGGRRNVMRLYPLQSMARVRRLRSAPTARLRERSQEMTSTATVY